MTSGNMSFTFAYGDASVTTPDLTEWELIVIGERSKIEPSQIRVENIKIQTTNHIAFQEVSVLLLRSNRIKFAICILTLKTKYSKIKIIRSGDPDLRRDLYAVAVSDIGDKLQKHTRRSARSMQRIE